MTLRGRHTYVKRKNKNSLFVRRLLCNYVSFALGISGYNNKLISNRISDAEITPLCHIALYFMCPWRARLWWSVVYGARFGQLRQNVRFKHFALKLFRIRQQPPDKCEPGSGAAFVNCSVVWYERF